MDLTRAELGRRIDQARGRGAADLAIKGARFLNVATGQLDQGDIAICSDWIVGSHDEYRGSREIDGRGRIAVPGFIDTHVHVESSLVTPFEFERFEDLARKLVQVPKKELDEKRKAKR